MLLCLDQAASTLTVMHHSLLTIYMYAHRDFPQCWPYPTLVDRIEVILKIVLQDALKVGDDLHSCRGVYVTVCETG